jgi:hypothetical protein
MKGVILAAAAAVLLSGPSASAGSSISWKPYTTSEFSIELPSNWRVLNRSSATHEAAIAAAEKSGNSSLALLLRSYRGTFKNPEIKFAAFEWPVVGGGYAATDLQVISKPMPGGQRLTARQIVGALVDYYRSDAAFSGVSSRYLRSARWGEVGVISYALRAKSAVGPTVSLAATQYVAIDGRQLFLVNFRSHPAKKQIYQSLYGSIFSRFQSR